DMTFYNLRPNAGLVASTNVTNSVVENNFVFGGANPRGVIGASGVTSDYNAHDGNWTSSSEGLHTLALSSTQALASVIDAATENFHNVLGAPINHMHQTQVSFSDDFVGDS